MKKIKIEISGMSCMGCVNSVEKSIKSLPGVKGVKVLLKKNIAILKIPDEVSVDEVKSKIEEAGYKPGEVLE